MNTIFALTWKAIIYLYTPAMFLYCLALEMAKKPLF